MKINILNIVVGLLIILAGALPLVVQYNLVALPASVPLTGAIYQAAIIVLGIAVIAIGKKDKDKGRYY